MPIGLGSGICGAIRTRDLLGLRTEIVGVQSTGAPAYALSLAAGQVVPTDRADTRADGMTTREPDPEAFAIIQSGAARIVTVTDQAIGEAIRAYWTDTHNLAEGAGAASLTALLRERDRVAGRRVGVVISDGNPEPNVATIAAAACQARLCPRALATNCGSLTPQQVWMAN